MQLCTYTSPSEAIPQLNVSSNRNVWLWSGHQRTFTICSLVAKPLSDYMSFGAWQLDNLSVALTVKKEGPATHQSIVIGSMDAMFALKYAASEMLN